MASSRSESTSTGGTQPDGASAATGAPALPLAPPSAMPAQTPTPVAAVPSTADLAPSRLRIGWLLLCFATTFAVYLVLVPRFLNYASPPTGDQPFYLMDTISLIQDGDLNVFNNYEAGNEVYFYRWAPQPVGFVGMPAPDPLPPQIAQTPARPEEEWYGSHLPGLSILLVPAWVIGSWFYLWWPATVVFMCLTGALLACNVFLLARELTGKVWVAVAVWLAISFAVPIMSYSYLIFTEMPTGLLVIYSFRRLALGWAANGPWRLLLVGVCIAYIPWMAWRCVPVAVALGAYALVQWWRYRREVQPTASPTDPAVARDGAAHLSRTRGLTSGTRGLALLLAPVVVSAGLVAAYSLFLYGTLVPASGGSLVRGQRPIFNWPWDGLDGLSRYLNGAFGLLFDRQMGLLVYAPVYLLVVVGVIAAFMLGRKSDRRLLLWIAAVTLPYIALLAAFEWWNGVWCPPARYWATFVPLAAAPLALSMVIIRSRLYRAIFSLLALVGPLFMAAIMVDPRRLFPHEREIMLKWPAESPDSPLHIDLTTLLPLFTPPDERTHLATTGAAFAVALAVVFAGYLLILRQRRTSAAVAWSPAAHLAVWLGVVAVLTAGWLGMNLDTFKTKTALTLVHEWTLDPPPDQPRGITVHDGKLYVTGYASRSLTALDLASGEQTAILPVYANTPLTYTHPGAVELGPDDLLYVLNNGEGPDAAFAMRPDGEVERRIPLEGKGPIAVGLDFGPGGALYVSDMVGGQVREYSLEGGEPLASWGGMAETFNNISGILVDGRSTIFAAETSEGRIQQIDSEGKFVRAYDLRCSPLFIAGEGDWLDVSCGNKLISLNKATGEIRSVQALDDAPLPEAPTGLTYGPDGTLYVVSNDKVFAYKVRR